MNIPTAFSSLYENCCQLKYFFPLQIAYLNSTVKELKKKVKLPGSARTLTNDIESLKKGMADTGGDITEIKDKIKQLTDLAGLQRGKMGKLATNVYNLSVSIIIVIFIIITGEIFN